MSRNKMRDKDEIRGVLSAAIKKDGNEVATELIMVEILEAFLDIRNILDKRMVKSIEISGGIEEAIPTEKKPGLLQDQINENTRAINRLFTAQYEMKDQISNLFYRIERIEKDIKKINKKGEKND